MQNNLRPEEELVRLAQQGQSEAFGELVRRSYSMSLKTAVAILRDREEAEDQVQNAYWRAYRYVGQFQGESQFSTWLTRIVVNQCLMRLRQARRAGLIYLDGAAGDRIELSSAGDSPEEVFGRKEFREILGREIRRIPPLLRNALLLRDVRRLSIEQTAKELGISVGAAKSRLLRARQELRRRLSVHATRKGVAPHLPIQKCV